MVEIFGIPHLKKGSGIHIKKKNRGKFTEYCGGKVTDECIKKAKKSKNPKLRKRATFAQNARSWSKKEQDGGTMLKTNFVNKRPIPGILTRKDKEGAKIHKPNSHRAIIDNGWIPTKRLKKGTYGLIKKHGDGGPAEIITNEFPVASRDNTYVQPFQIFQIVPRYKPEVKAEQVVDTRSEAQKKYSETFNRLGGKDLSSRGYQARTEEANKYTIPYIPEKEIRLTTGRYNTGKISTNLLDSVYNASQRTGVPFDIALGLAGRESTLGIGRGFKKGSNVSGTDLYSNWQQIQAIINSNKTVDIAQALFAKIRNKEQLSDDEFNFLTSYLENEQKELDSTKAMKENPIDNALKYYASGKYNPGDKRHTQMVEEDAKILMSDPAIRQWMKQKGIL